MAKRLPIVFIEGMVYNGEVEDVKLLPCEEGFAKVIVKARDGAEYETRCLHRDAAQKLYSVWLIYLNRGWSVHSETTD